MKYENMFKLQFISRSANEGFARGAVAAFLSQLDPTMEEIADIKTAVSEAVTNSIVHAYREKLGVVYINIYILDKRKIVIDIKDKGCGIPDIEQAMEPLFTTAPESERSGLGFTLMETFMDKIKVRSTEGKGTTVHMTKTLKAKERV